MRIIGCVLLLFLTVNISAQHLINPITSLHDSREFIIGIDNRITRINDQFGVIYGLYSGIGYGENLRFKLSVSGTPFEIGKFSPEVTTSRVSRLLFVSIGQEVDFYTIGRFKFTTYLNAGFGNHYFRVLNDENLQILKDRDYIWPLEVGLHGRYQISPLFAFKTGGGWRFVFPEETDLSGLYLKLTLVVNPKNLKMQLRHRKEKRASSKDS